PSVRDRLSGRVEAVVVGFDMWLICGRGSPLLKQIEARSASKGGTGTTVPLLALRASSGVQYSRARLNFSCGSHGGDHHGPTISSSTISQVSSLSCDAWSPISLVLRRPWPFS